MEDIDSFAVVRIVDDDAGVRESYKFLIESDSWLVKTYCSAEDFLEHDTLRFRAVSSWMSVCRD